jgi:hypothetical protein
MHVVWKRPDGFHGAAPTDFEIVSLANQTTFWLHKEDHDWYPFRVSGGWQEQESTKRLNTLINLISKPSGIWLECTISIFHNSMIDEPSKFFNDLSSWVKDLRNHLKGDTWEVDIMSQAISEVHDNLEKIEKTFLEKALN